MGRYRSYLKPVSQPFLENLREIDIRLSSQLIHPCGNGDGLRDAPLGFLLSDNIHADGDKGGEVPFRKAKLLYRGGRGNGVVVR